MTRIGGVCILLLAQSACADRAGYPSLARRPAEIYVQEPTSPDTPAPTAADTGTDVQLARLRQTAAAAHARFAARRATAERAAELAGPLGSESWAAASVALAALEEAHDQQTATLAEIDQLQADRQVADAGADDAGTAAILAARDDVATGADADGAVVARLRDRLAR